MSNESMQYLKSQTVGTRDTHVLGAMRKRGIPSYFSGCFTLFLSLRLPLEKSSSRHAVVIIDPLRPDKDTSGQDSLPNLIPPHIYRERVEYSHIVGSRTYLEHPYRQINN